MSITPTEPTPAALAVNVLGVTAYELQALAGVAALPGAPENTVLLHAAARRAMRACATTRTTAPTEVTPASVVTEVTYALQNGSEVPQDAGQRFVAAEAALAAAGAQRQVVQAAAVQIGQQVRSKLAADGDWWLESVVRARHDDLMDQAHAAMTNIDPAQLLDPAALAAKGAGDLTTAYRRLAEVHAQLEPVRAAHAALLCTAQGTSDQVVPDTDVSLAELRRTHAADCPRFVAAWPACNSPQRPAPVSPWDAGPVATMVLLLAHGSWVPARDELATLWRQARDHDLAQPRRVATYA